MSDPFEPHAGYQKISVLHKLKKFIIANIEKFFIWYGHLIALYPWRFIIGCLIFAAFGSTGLIWFRQEKNPIKLWIPHDSNFRHDTEWIIEKFKEGYRMQYLLITAPNVLEPSVIQEMERIRKEVVGTTVANTTWEDVCFSKNRIPKLYKVLMCHAYWLFCFEFILLQQLNQIPAVKSSLLSFIKVFSRRKRFFFSRAEDENPDGGFLFNPAFIGYSRYCSIVKNLPQLCFEVNLGQLWENDDRLISRLTTDDVIETLNTTKVSPVYGHAMTFNDLLGDVTADEKGKIISASSLLSIWITHVNFSAVNIDETGNAAGTSDLVTGPSLAWEKGYLDLLSSETESHRNTNMSIYYEAGRSFGDISSDSMFQDVGKLFIGTVLMFCFVQFVLPNRFNWVELRFVSGCIGLLCVGLSFILAVSFCSFLGIFYGPVHTSLPFLLLGIGVDDMFVIIACLKNLTPSERTLKLEEKIAIVLKHAGVSITVTSVTDLIAFLVGSFTIIPSLHSFCLYTAAGIFFMFIFQATMFVAFLSIDEERIQRGVNSFIWCMKHENFKFENFPRESFQTTVFEYVYKNFVFKLPFKIFIILVTVGLTGVAIKGNLELKQKFDPKWFLPESSYLLQFYNKRNVFYPDVGKDGGIYVGNIDYSEEFSKIHQLYLSFQNESNIVKNIDTWTVGFIRYTKSVFHTDLLNETLPREKFLEYLSKFLWSPKGARYQKNFRFDGDFTCGEPPNGIIMSCINFVFKNFKGPEEHIPAMNRLNEIIKEINITTGDGFATVWSKIFANWVTDAVIDQELYRNLGMALCCIMVCTGILILDLQICFWIFLCVFLTLIDVAGFIYFWGLYIDVASCIALVMAVGLCVDYAAHVGHIFLTVDGTREERSLKTVKYIGTATANGAFSTLLAVAMLGDSDAYIFQTFFKIFFLVTVFGLFHGIVFLPVILSLIGPETNVHENEFRKSKSIRMEAIKNGSEEVRTLRISR